MTGGEGGRAVPTCPDCGEEIVFTSCGLDPNASDEAIAAFREIVVAAHRYVAHVFPGERLLKRAQAWIDGGEVSDSE